MISKLSGVYLHGKVILLIEQLQSDHRWGPYHVLYGEGLQAAMLDQYECLPFTVSERILRVPDVVVVKLNKDLWPEEVRIRSIPGVSTDRDWTEPVNDRVGTVTSMADRSDTKYGLVRAVEEDWLSYHNWVVLADYLLDNNEELGHAAISRIVLPALKYRRPLYAAVPMTLQEWIAVERPTDRTRKLMTAILRNVRWGSHPETYHLRDL